MIPPGSWVKFKHSTGERMFRGQILYYLGTDRYYAWVQDNTPLGPRIVRSARLEPGCAWYEWSEQ